MATRTAAKGLKKKTVKKLKDKNAPKAPLTPYLRWGQEQSSKDPSLQSMTIGQRGKVLGDMWKSVSEDEKESIKSEYQKEKEAYLKEFEAYKKTDNYKKWLKQKDALATEEKSGGKKKRTARSAYNVYFKEQYPILSAPKEGEEKPQMKDVASALAKQWKAYTDEERAAYQEKADKINKEKREAEYSKKEESDNEEEEEEEEVSEEEE
ncbi:high mobility group protein [Vairimorpha necatrix]|uniref:High mobility group protein n=1 Tax=Vairimorpha necatrix TaxID=6039 RepID=A0AAX4J9G3_9MICR